jgi:hypothetical protein
MGERQHATQALAAVPQWTPERQEFHRAPRALQNIAHEICATELTDGFCGPREGKCTRQHKPGGCIRRAEACLQAMATSGVIPIWVYDAKIFKAGDAS